MVRLMRWMLVPAFVVWLVGATPVVAQNRTSFVHDDAGFFSKEAVATANAEINQIKNQFHRELVVDTVATVKRPENVDKNDAQAVNRFFDSWALNRASDERVNGLYIAIVQNPPKVRVLEGNKTEQSGAFQANDRRQLEELVIANLKAAHGDEMKNREKNDKVLLDAVHFVRQHIHAAQAAQQRQAAPVHRGEIPWIKYLLIGVGIFLVIWIVFGLIRALSGGGARGGYGGYGAPGYSGGGGGGGFFSSLLGGMFGAAAGMWMYNNFFGGHSNSAWGAGPDAGGSSGGNDADTSYSGGGGDYGDAGGDQGGGDAGGGDWGGGGGGGGDWGGGGGGGDFGGGGGGGDW